MSQPENCDLCRPEKFAWRTVHEDGNVISLLSDPRMVLGHTIVIPREHREPPESLTDAEKVAMLLETERLSRLMLGSFAVGVDVWQKTRPYMPENAIRRRHYHTHVIPCEPGDGTYESGLIWTPDRFSELTHAEAKTVLEVLRAE